jgi:hypothetical protein
MPDTADPQPRRDASAKAAAPTSFKPVALPALAGVLNARKACEGKTEAPPKTPPHDDLDRFGRSYTA